jgi:hypothetical protein
MLLQNTPFQRLRAARLSCAPSLCISRPLRMTPQREGLLCGFSYAIKINQIVSNDKVVVATNPSIFIDYPKAKHGCEASQVGTLSSGDPFIDFKLLIGLDR